MGICASISIRFLYASETSLFDLPGQQVEVLKGAEAAKRGHLYVS